ncbi:MAG: AAA family ATPase [Desulfamplus sp.]|nr:AAA family ATPase [Desulfamplus sp.]
MITRVKFDKFTAFEQLEINCSPNINIFIGKNGTGKTHILKTIYAACDIIKSRKNFAEKITKVFLPSKEYPGRLVKRSNTSVAGSVEVYRKFVEKDEEIKIRISLSNHVKSYETVTISGSTKRWYQTPFESVYIPVKEMLSNAPGFRSLYNSRQISFEEIYADIIDRALLPFLKGPADRARKKILTILQNEMEGKISIDNEEFFLRNRQGKLEFSLLAEGFRKLGLLWVLIQNGTLLNGSVLFWDEPEANLNPQLMKTVVEIILELQRMGVQIFIATHDYVLLKEFDLQALDTDNIKFHSLYRNEKTNEIEVKDTRHYLHIDPNSIDDTFADLVDREIERSMGGLGR